MLSWPMSFLKGRERVKNAGERIGDIIEILKKNYPRSRTALKFETPLQILVATILSAQCTDEKVNQITPSLFRRYPEAKDFALST